MEKSIMKEAYSVGYGKPPKEYQFKKGQSGNPKGRPRKTKSFHELVAEELNENITTTINGKNKRLSKKEALIRKVFDKAIKTGDLKYTKWLLDLDEQNKNLKPEFNIDEHDEHALKRFMDRIGITTDTEKTMNDKDKDDKQ